MADSIDASAYDALTFDCYGTLIDWETGLLRQLKPILERNDAHVIDGFILDYFGSCETRIEHGPYQSYRSVLTEVLAAFGERLGFTPTAEERLNFAQSVGDWLPFPDTIAALKRLGSRFQLAVISNIDDDLFDLTQARLGINFDHVITAQQVGAYKPDTKPFTTALARIGIDKHRLLHVAQSRYHDIAPAKALGLATAWIDRRGGAPGGATPEHDAVPTFTFDSLTALADALVPARDGS
jgi:2-haloacid dehalogenase